MSLKRLAVGLGLTAAMGLAALAPAAPVSAQSCHPSYGGCLPIVYDLDCWEIGYAVVEVWNVWDDPYGLDDYNGPGNGWTCDSYHWATPREGPCLRPVATAHGPFPTA